MGNCASCPKKDTNEKITELSLGKSISRFVGELEPCEKYHLGMASLGLFVNALTNLTYPRMVGLLIDSAEEGKISNVERCPEYNLPYPISYFSRVHSKFEGINSCSLFNRLLLYSLPIYVAGSLASWVRVYNTNMAIYLIQKRCRRRIFEKIMEQDLFFFHSKTTNYLISKLMTECEEGPKTYVETYTHFLRCCNSTIGGTARLFSISPLLALVTLSSIPLAGVSIRLLSSILKKQQLIKKEKLDEIMAKAEEVITGIENVIAFAKEEHEVESFVEELNKGDQASIESSHSEGVFMGSILGVTNLSTIIMIYFGCKQMKSGRLTMGKFASFIIYGGLIGLGAHGLSKIYNQLLKASTSMERIYEITDLKEKEEKGLKLEEVKGDIEVSKVEFEYPTRKGKILKNVTMKIDAGEVIGIVGPSGGGKTTLCKIIMTMYKPKEGKIYLDSTDTEILSSKWLRSEVFSMVTQEPILFSMSIEENMKYGKKEVTKEEIIEASKECNLHEFIESLPMKYETEVGPRGVMLSTGQKQRIALVRAILKEAKVLILDEPTSSLDGLSEELVKTAIKMSSRDKTVIIVTHRPEILKMVTKVAVINGSLEYFGSLEEAKSKSETFKTIFPSL